MDTPVVAVDEVSAFNTSAWAAGNYVRAYTGGWISPPEAVAIARARDELAGPVLELGCGPGRVTSVLVALSPEVRAIDISPRMVEACRRNVPGATVEERDLLHLSDFPAAAFSAVVGAANVLDILGDVDRATAMRELHRILRPSGLLLFSSHNRAAIATMAAPTRLFDPGPDPTPRALLTAAARAVWRASRLRLRLANRRRARRFERDELDYAIVNDDVHDSRLAHYYIGRDAQDRQLSRFGFRLEACTDEQGREVPAGDEAAGSGGLMYAARRLP